MRLCVAAFCAHTFLIWDAFTIHYKGSPRSTRPNKEDYKIFERIPLFLPKQKLTIGSTSIERWIPTSDCRRTVKMITMYCIGTTPVSNVVSILVTNIVQRWLSIFLKYWLYTFSIKPMFYK